MRSRLVSHSARALSSPCCGLAERTHHHARHWPRRPARRSARRVHLTAEWAARRALLSPASFTCLDQQTQHSLITVAFTTLSAQALTHHSALCAEWAAEPNVGGINSALLTSRLRLPTHHHNRLLPRSALRGN